jgi:hypothetical protein
VTAITKCREQAIGIGKEAKDNRWPPGSEQWRIRCNGWTRISRPQNGLTHNRRTMTALFVAKREIEIDPDKRESARVRVTQRLLTSDARLDNEPISVMDQKDRAYKSESGCCGVLA